MHRLRKPSLNISHRHEKWSMGHPGHSFAIMKGISKENAGMGGLSSGSEISI